MNRTVFSCQEAAADLCAGEFEALLPEATLEGWLDAGVGVLRHEIRFEALSSILKKRQPIFTRHVFPIQAQADAQADWAGAFAQWLPETLAGPASVQIRAAADAADLDKAGFLRAAEAALSARGAVIDSSSPVWVLSAYLANRILYMGVSRAADNLSAWPGGMRRYAMRPDTVSRAEFKLLEALEVFSLDTAGMELAMDLGAAPGGWTRVLTERGVRVAAVDPAHLAETVAADPRVEVYGMLAEEFLKREKRQFDLIVNDMRLEVPESARIMLGAAERLKTGGMALMTFKLGRKKRMAAIERGLSILRAKYKILRVKQLFHNRSEVTVLMQKAEIPS